MSARDASTTTSTTTLLEVLAEQRAVLLDAAARGVDGVALYRAAFDVVERAALADARSRLAHGSRGDVERGALLQFVARTEASQREGVRVDEHLLQLAQGWRCASCASDVPQGIAITGVAGGRAAVKLEVVCRACGAQSRASDAGHTHFDRVFGPLVTTSWNPTRHGFVWDRR